MPDAAALDELDDSLRGELRGAENEYLEKVHGLRGEGLERLIVERLVAKKAKAAGVSPEALLEREVTAKLGEPTDEELRRLYDAAGASGQQLPPFDEIRAEILGYVKGKSSQQALDDYRGKLLSEAKVERELPPLLLPKVEVAAVGPSKGEANAPVTIVEFSDFECPYCSKVEPVMKKVLEEYRGKVRLVYRDFPLPSHAQAPKASEAALCAGDQGKYWEMHDRLFAHQRALAVDQLKGYARELALDAGKFDQCLDSGAKTREVEASRKAGQEAGVSGTPAFFVNGRPLSGAQPFERFKEVIDAELAGK
jgi:protein-disulfide isomerase